MKMYIPSKAAEIIRELAANGFEAYAVGGCVRDSILGREPEDWDITTSARPEQVKQIFSRTVDTGIEHGTVTVLMDKDAFEVTTYRVDGEYEDHRHPKEVTFTASLEEDLKRRDFTINAMAYNPETGLVDIFHGMEDLERKVIRCVGNPGERFDEDALRILRAIRFSAQLGFSIDEATKAAMSERVEALREVSAERIRVELVKLLVSNHPERIREAYALGITRVILPEYDGIVGVAQHPEVSAEMCRKIMRRLKFDNHTLEKVYRLVKWHGLKYLPNDVSVRRALNRVGKDIFEEFIKVQRADISAKNPSVVPKKMKQLEEKENIYRKILRRGDCFEVKMLSVNGKDLIQAGIPQGPILGAVLERLVELVIDSPELNEKGKLLELAGQVQKDPTIFNEKEYFFEK